MIFFLRNGVRGFGSQNLQRHIQACHFTNPLEAAKRPWTPVECGLILRLLEHFLDTTLLADRRTEGVEGKGHLT